MMYTWFFTAIALCGASPLHSSNNRITNGNPATDFQYPYMLGALKYVETSYYGYINPEPFVVAQLTNYPPCNERRPESEVSIQEISLLQFATRGHRCGGVLITYQHVLTAASCFFRAVNTSLVQASANEFRVFGGSANLTNDVFQDRVRFIANVTIHPEYIGFPSLVNNIAIVTLQVPFANTTVSPIGIPTDNFVPADFALCTVAGWGSTDVNEQASAQLRYTTKYIYNQDLCTTIYNTVPYISNIFPSMICAASYDILSAGCNGDHGNALVCNGGLTGILSVTNNCEASSYPEVYTRVSNYTTWITSVTGAAYTFRPDLMFYLIFVLIQIVTIKVIS